MWAMELLWGVLLLEIAESLRENTDDLKASLSYDSAFLQVTVDFYQICAPHKTPIIFYFWIGQGVGVVIIGIFAAIIWLEFLILHVTHVVQEVGLEY